MIGIVDYGAGNLQSVANALDRLGLRHTVCGSADDLERVSRILLPGVGQFGAAARALARGGLDRAIVRRVRDDGAPLLGICLGLQLLLDGSDEAPEASGLGLIAGRATRLNARVVPHMGWNRVLATASAVADGHYYFAHEYVAEPLDAADVLGTARVEDRDVPVVIGRGPALGVQFHPEKSDACGLRVLEAFARC